jgi:hypothetical protein
MAVGHDTRSRLAAAGRHQPASGSDRPAGTVAWVLEVLRLAFVVWACVELARGRTGDAVALLITFVVLHVPLALRLPYVFDVAFLVVWTLQELGQVAGFWTRFPWWDTLVHGAMPAVLAPTAFVLLVRLDVLPNLYERPGPRATIGAVMVVFLIAAGFGSVYEIYEWFSDLHFGTHYQPDNFDTMTDITMNDIGGLVGGIGLAFWARSRARSSDRSDQPAVDAQALPGDV